MTIIAIDPGREKCGLCVMTRLSSLLREIVPLSGITERVKDLARKHSIELIIIGNGTGSEKVKKSLSETGLKCVLVDERNTTLEARGLYFSENPPRGLKRLLPKGLLVPPGAYDGYVAQVIGQRYFETGG